MLTWLQLARLPERQLASRDIAETNLACARELPDGPSPDEVRRCFGKLDHMARCLQAYTDRRMPEFFERPEHYDHSEASFEWSA
jgi:hypothetical protein